jgi:hypothetical protein
LDAHGRFVKGKSLDRTDAAINEELAGILVVPQKEHERIGAQCDAVNS